MKKDKKYYKNIDFIRFIACLAILLYHLKILQGGYLAVCTFFVLSGYLSCISAFRKEKFSLLSYYKNRLLKIYLPLMVVVFITISITSFFPDMIWLNLKPEATSILLGYNNFWQLSANLDYFAGSTYSPFIHLWYISILLQFDLVFPFIYLILHKIGDKTKKIIPCIITITLSVVGSIYFYKMSVSQDIMITYYDTFTRIFSLLFGLSLGFIHSYYGPFIPKFLKNTIFHRITFYLYLLILLSLYIFVDAKSIFFAPCMIASTLITCRLIDYGTTLINKDLPIYDKLIKYLAGISYEVYLLQYPIIFFFQNIYMNDSLKLFIIIILIFILSSILHFGMSFYKKKNKYRIVTYASFIVILCFTLHGAYQYVLAKDHTAEMKQLEEQMTKNEKLMQEKQKEYTALLKQEEDAWLSTMKDFENYENELKSVVTNLSVVGVGDSVMLGAADQLYKTFPHGYFDAKVSRTAWVVNGILKDLKNRGMLRGPIILNLGANGDCPLECKKEIMRTCSGHKVFWLNVTNDRDVHVNSRLNSLASKYKNLYIIDWNKISRGHPEYFVADGIHLTETGKKAYSKVIYNAIYQVYLKEYREKKEETIRQHEEQVKKKISFYGNDLLLNAFDDIQVDFKEAKFMINKNFSYKTLKEEIEASVRDNSLTHKIVFTFDNLVPMGLTEYQNLIDLCKGHEIYIVSMNPKGGNLFDLNSEQVTIIDFYQELQKNKNYLMADGIHLTEDGNKALHKLLKDAIL